MEKKVALITGASRGIGAATARVFARAGWRVGIHYNNSEAAALALCAELGRENAVPLQADVADPAQVEAMFKTLEGSFGPPEALICSAGLSLQKLVTDTTDADYRRLLSVNLDGVFFCCRRAIPHMVREKKGSIVTISSMWGLTGACMESVYAASKAAVQAFSQSLASELGPSGIRVNCIAPGVIDTDMNACHSPETLAALAEETPLGRLGKAEEIGELALFLASEQASFVTGQVIAADGGFLLH